VISDKGISGFFRISTAFLRSAAISGDQWASDNIEETDLAVTAPTMTPVAAMIAKPRVNSDQLAGA
jgi:hypothetical protein